MKLSRRLRQFKLDKPLEKMNVRYGLRSVLINFSVAIALFAGVTFAQPFVAAISSGQRNLQTSLVRLESASAILRELSFRSFITNYYNRYLKPRVEPDRVKSVKEQFPGLLNEFYFSDLRSFRELLVSFGLEREKLELDIFALSDRLYSKNYDCSISGGCGPDRNWKLKDRAAVTATEILYDNVLPAMLSGDYQARDLEIWSTTLVETISRIDYSFFL
ncbi:MAG: hypothetical protein ACU0BK_10620 [Shimia sp.]|uniref:hypothetical protein n=1 Tax=Shimia sp. TaxID=1954381 RepID=UPI00405A0C49